MMRTKPDPEPIPAQLFADLRRAACDTLVRFYVETRASLPFVTLYSRGELETVEIDATGPGGILVGLTTAKLRAISLHASVSNFAFSLSRGADGISLCVLSETPREILWAHLGGVGKYAVEQGLSARLYESAVSVTEQDLISGHIPSILRIQPSNAVSIDGTFARGSGIVWK